MRLALILVVIQAAAVAQHHYVFFNRDRHRIAEKSFLDTAALEGAQLKYTWRELEPSKGNYRFGEIHADLRFLESKGKRLWIQVQDSSFAASIVNVPEDIGKVRQYRAGRGKALPEGWVARRWDPEVRARFHRLLTALGSEFDGRIEGINLAETSIGVAEEGAPRPEGFTPEIYRDAILENIVALKRAFPKSVAMQYANFMPGEWLPWTDKGYLRDVYAAARRSGAGVGAPDLLPHRRGQLNHAYPLIRQSAGSIPAAIAVQDGNYEQTDPKTGKRLTIAALHTFARDSLHVDYMFWGAQEPFYSRDLLPYLGKLEGAQRLNRRNGTGARGAVESGYER